MKSVNQETISTQPIITVGPISSRRSKAPIIIAIVLFLFALGGGGYYEFFYLPPTYSKAVLNVIKEVETKEKDTPRPENTFDQVSKLVAVKQQTDFLKQVKVEVSRLQPPFFGELRQFHKDLLAMIDAQLKVYSQSEEKIAFFGGILEMETVFQPKHLDQKTAKMKDMQKHFEDVLPKIQARIDEVFAKEPSFEFKDVTLFQMKSAWEEAKSGFEVWLGFMKRQDPEQPLNVGVPISPTKKEEEALKKIIQFLDLVKKASESNVELSQLSSPSDKESKERGQRINKVIEELRNKYGQ